MFPLETMSTGIVQCLLTCRLEALKLGEVSPSSNLSSSLLRRILYIHKIFLLAHPQIWNSKVHIPVFHLGLLGLNRFMACIRFLILFEIILSEVSLLQNKYYFLSNDKLSLPTGQLHQVLWKMFSQLLLSLKKLFFIILFNVR